MISDETRLAECSHQRSRISGPGFLRMRCIHLIVQSEKIGKGKVMIYTCAFMRCRTCRASSHLPSLPYTSISVLYVTCRRTRSLHFA